MVRQSVDPSSAFCSAEHKHINTLDFSTAATRVSRSDRDDARFPQVTLLEEHHQTTRSQMDESAIYSDGRNPLLSLAAQTSSGVSPLEQEVLDEYLRLLNNMNEASLKQRIGAGQALWPRNPNTTDLVRRD